MPTRRILSVMSWRNLRSLLSPLISSSRSRNEESTCGTSAGAANSAGPMGVLSPATVRSEKLLSCRYWSKLSLRLWIQRALSSRRSFTSLSSQPHFGKRHLLSTHPDQRPRQVTLRFQSYSPPDLGTKQIGHHDTVLRFQEVLRHELLGVGQGLAFQCSLALLHVLGPG